jgi:hypothetical protein
MELLARLKAGRDALGSVTVNGVDLGLRILTEQDYQDAALAADALLARHDAELTVATADTFEAEKSLVLVSRMLVDPVTRKPVFATADQARAMFMRADKQLIMEKYLEHERKFSPSAANMNEAEFAALLEEVKKNPGTPQLNDLSGDLLKRLISSLASPPPS